ncbi:MAG TPA: hypothetical protein VGS20_07285 [Candidatus Acidoferrales bacterium]|nr:hypothetical protein [Candidatus Acidoferrales bacterium]
MSHRLKFIPYVDGTVQLRNETGRSIYGIEMFVNYDGARGHRIFTVKYEAQVKGSGLPMPSSGAFLRGVLTGPVRPGETFDLEGTNLLATTTIPSKAGVSFMYLQLSTENTVTPWGTGTSSDPILYEAPAGFGELGGSADNLPEDFLLKLDVDARGTVRGVDPAPGSASPGPLVASAIGAVKRWRFYPAVRDGFAVPTEFFLLLQFRRADFPAPRDCFLGQGDKYPQTFAVVSLETDPKYPGHWEWLYGIYYDVNGWKAPFYGRQQFYSTPRMIKSP